jgi:hypothetical protein
MLLVQVICLGYNKNDEESHGQCNENLAWQLGFATKDNTIDFVHTMNTCL